jgi:small multidrug resistance family-3 protein
VGFPKLTIFGFLILATALEVFGDAVVRMGLGQQILANRLIYFAGGAVLLFGYGLSLNTAPIEFEKVLGVYIATLFVMWQIVSFMAFRTVPSLPTLVGGALIIAGGLVVAFWQPISLGQQS